MIVISNNLVLQPTFAPTAGHPVFGWRNLVTVSNIVADTEDVAFPVINLANPSTALFWRGTNTNDQTITITISQVEPIDYLAIAGHNFGSGLVAIKIQGRANLLDPFTDLTQQVIPADDAPLLFRFVPQSLVEIRIALEPSAVIPQAAVVYTGTLLIAERSIKVDEDHTPINLGRKTEMTDGISESGQYLGSVVRKQMTETAMAFGHFDPVWYRANFDPFLVAAQGGPNRPRRPFFVAWSPARYPNDVGYAWLLSDPMPMINLPTGRMSVKLSMQAIVR